MSSFITSLHTRCTLQCAGNISHLASPGQFGRASLTARQCIHTTRRLRSPKRIKPYRKTEDMPSTTRSSAPRSCVTGRTASSFAGVDGIRSVREMEDGSENADLQLTNDYFKEYREALQAVLPSHYSFRVRKVEPPLEHVCGDQLAFGKVLIGRRRDKEASVWAFLEGQNGERVMYRDSDKETVLLPLQLDDFVEFEAVFQLISDPMDLRKFASATEMTRRKRWVGRIALVVRLVLRDFAFYSPTIRVSDTRLKKEAVVEIIRRNLDAMKPYIGHKPSRNGLRTSVESSESQERDGEAASGNIGEQFADHSSASQLASGLAATGDEIQAATRGNTSPGTLKWVTEPSTPDQEGRKRDSTASPTINSAQHTRSNSIKSTSEPSSPVQKKARLASDAASDTPVCYDESIQQGSVDAQSQAVAPLLQTQQSPKEAQLRSLTLKGFAERKVKEARQQERDKAAEKIASVECQLQALQNTIDTQRQALEEQEKKHQKAQEQSAATIYSRDQRISNLESEVQMLRRLKQGFDEFDRSWVVEMLRDQAYEELGTEGEANGDAVEAYVKHAFERNYGIPLYGDADSKASQVKD